MPTHTTIESGYKVISKFVTFVYMEPEKDLNEARLSKFIASSSKQPLREIPPSADSLLLHVKCCSYQAGWIWGNTLTERSSSSPDGWGWSVVDGCRLVTIWSNTDTMAKNTF